MVQECVRCGAENFQEILQKYNQQVFWGLSASIDIRECSFDIINSQHKIHQYIVEISDLIKVKRFGEPQIVFFGEEERIRGYTFCQMIETSLISGHLVEATRAAYIDVFSCSLFNPYEVAAFSQNFFQGNSSDLQILFRE